MTNQELLAAMKQAGRLTIVSVGDAIPKNLAICIQCTEPRTKVIGDFAFDPEKTRDAVSPVFSDLLQLFDWLRKNGYSSTGHNSEFPCGFYSLNK